MCVKTAKTRILLAEEDIVQRLLIREYLEMERRYEVSETEGLHPLLALCGLRTYRDALLLLDMQWSGEGVMEILPEIRKRNPGILILGLADRDDRAVGKSHLGKLRFSLLYKPFSPRHLHRCIAAILEDRPCPKP